jgi:hypothetical protein
LLDSTLAPISLHQVTKELAGKVLLADKVAFQSMARLLFPVAYKDLWRPRMARLMQAIHAVSQSVSQSARRSHL